ncbi:hypothetical protein WG954_05815 [Lacibacter sp. H375]|uniref:hypothetical protein n=1 Tax=Lacibacter sp. H375 TaxID=3133424 RepID=UPI0030BA94D9
MSKENINQDFYVTHFIYEPPADEGYIRLSFMTATAESLRKNIFYMGFSKHRPFDVKFLKAKIDAGSLIKLNTPHKIVKEKSLWMDTMKNVFIADKSDPFKDEALQQVYNPNFISESVLASRNKINYGRQRASRRASFVEIGNIYNSTFPKSRISVERYTKISTRAVSGKGEHRQNFDKLKDNNKKGGNERRKPVTL